MSSRITGFIFIGLGLLTLIFFRHYTGQLIPHPFLFWILGILLILTGAWLIQRSSLSALNRMQTRTDEVIRQLKINGECIRVDFAVCQIKEYHYSEDRSAYADNILPGEIGMYNAIIGEDWRNVQKTDVLQSVIIFIHKNSRTGEEERFISPAISKDRITLSFYLEQQKSTFLYVNKNNRQQYYFDLGFLYQ